MERTVTLAPAQRKWRRGLAFVLTLALLLVMTVVVYRARDVAPVAPVAPAASVDGEPATIVVSDTPTFRPGATITAPAGDAFLVWAKPWPARVELDGATCDVVKGDFLRCQATGDARAHVQLLFGAAPEQITVSQGAQPAATWERVDTHQGAP